MKPAIYQVPSLYPGALYIMPKPSKERLDDDIGYFRSIGVDVVVSMLGKNEEAELGLQEEAKICAQHQIQFLQFGISDLGLPDLTAFTNFVDDITVRLTEGKTVAVHCKAGIGRSGMLVCCALTRLGISASEAIDLASRSRGIDVPDTAEQVAFIHQFAAI